MTKFLAILLALCLLALSPCHADQIKQGAGYQRTVLMTSSSDHVTGATGLTLTITESQAGGAYATITPTVTPLGNGIYSIALTASNTNTLGALDMHFTAMGADPSDTHDQVLVDVPGGSVASVTAPVVASSVTGNVGGNLAGSVGSVATPIILPLNAPTTFLADDTTVTALGTAIAGNPAATVTAMKADGLISTLLHHNMGKFTYNATTHSLQLLLDDGVTALGAPMTLTVDSNSNITARQ